MGRDSEFYFLIENIFANGYPLRKNCIRVEELLFSGHRAGLQLPRAAVPAINLRWDRSPGQSELSGTEETTSTVGLLTAGEGREGKEEDWRR